MCIKLYLHTRVDTSSFQKVYAQTMFSKKSNFGGHVQQITARYKPLQKKKKDIRESGTENGQGERLIFHVICLKAPYYPKGNYTSEKVAGVPQQICGKRVSTGKRQAEPQNIYLEVYFCTLAELGNLKTLINKHIPGTCCIFCQQTLEV